jgi:hypothetical protein
MPPQNDRFGRIAEKALCLALNTDFVGKFPEQMLPEAEALAVRFAAFRPHLPGEYTHTAARGARYDYTSPSGYLSLKTTLKDYKVCPQVIGQTTKKNWSIHFGLPGDSNPDVIKRYIEADLPHILSEYFKYTFESPVVHYNKKNGQGMLIAALTPIDWTNEDFTLTRSGEAWTESTTLKIGNITVGEFQIHNHRNNVKFRWDLKKLLAAFPANFTVTSV